MRKFLCALILLSCTAVLAEKPASAPSPTPTAKLRVAGIFVFGFSVWRVELPNCTAAGKPWLKLDCGIFKCSKPASLGIPLDLDYSNWRKSPRQTEIEIEADKPFAMFLGGDYVTASIGDGFLAAAGLPYTVNTTSCIFNASFTPRAGAMYEATIDPAGKGCTLRFTEIRWSESKNEHERLAIDGAETQACAK